jgi:hypothetical protein
VQVTADPMHAPDPAAGQAVIELATINEVKEE